MQMLPINADLLALFGKVLLVDADGVDLEDNVLSWLPDRGERHFEVAL